MRGTMKKSQNFLPQVNDEATVRGRERSLHICKDTYIYLAYELDMIFFFIGVNLLYNVVSF